MKEIIETLRTAHDDEKYRTRGRRGSIVLAAVVSLAAAGLLIRDNAMLQAALIAATAAVTVGGVLWAQSPKGPIRAVVIAAGITAAAGLGTGAFIKASGGDATWVWESGVLGLAIAVLALAGYSVKVDILDKRPAVEPGR